MAPLSQAFRQWHLMLPHIPCIFRALGEVFPDCLGHCDQTRKRRETSQCFALVSIAIVSLIAGRAESQRGYLSNAMMRNEECFGPAQNPQPLNPKPKCSTELCDSCQGKSYGHREDVAGSLGSRSDQAALTLETGKRAVT